MTSKSQYIKCLDKKLFFKNELKLSGRNSFAFQTLLEHLTVRQTDKRVEGVGVWTLRKIGEGTILGSIIGVRFEANNKSQHCWYVSYIYVHTALRWLQFNTVV